MYNGVKNGEKEMRFEDNKQEKRRLIAEREERFLGICFEYLWKRWQFAFCTAANNEKRDLTISFQS